MIIDDHFDIQQTGANLEKLRELLRQDEELVELAKRMRDAQKKYFRTRTRSDLIEAKNLEVEFDQKAGINGANK